MCWYSVEHSGQEAVQAEAGQRLAIRKMHWNATRWVVRDNDAQQTPAPVCLLDGTRVMFRPNETDQAAMQLKPDAQAVFRMLERPKRDVFEFEGGREIEVNKMPDGLLFDVLVIPGREDLSRLVTEKPMAEPVSGPERETVRQRENEDESLFARLLNRW
jgi:hypothetical protein